MPSNDLIYFDYAAATPLDQSVLAAMQPYFSDQFYNPSATYLPAVGVHKAIEAARGQVAHWLGTRPSEIIFTAGGTEANNLAIHGVMRQYPTGNVVVSNIEHESVLVPADRYDCRRVAVTSDGRVNLDDLSAKIDDNTTLVSIMYANNEVGSVQPLRDIAKIINDVRAQRPVNGLPLYFHTDACQAANYLDLHVARLGVDLLTLNGGKIYGPKQSGALYTKAGIELQPLIDGGGQERNLRSGTQNVAGAIGLAAALELAQTTRHKEVARLKRLQQVFMSTSPELTLNGSHRFRLPNNLHVTMPGHDNERLLMLLEQAGILAAAGSACSASNQQPSHVLRAMGISQADAQSSLRFTMGRGTTADHIDYLVASLTNLGSP